MTATDFCRIYNLVRARTAKRATIRTRTNHVVAANSADVLFTRFTAETKHGDGDQLIRKQLS
jgi:hypothetical protein